MKSKMILPVKTSHIPLSLESYVSKVVLISSLLKYFFSETDHYEEYSTALCQMTRCIIDDDELYLYSDNDEDRIFVEILQEMPNFAEYEKFIMYEVYDESDESDD